MNEDKKKQIAEEYLTLYGPQTPEQIDVDQKRSFTFNDVQEILDLCWSGCGYSPSRCWNRILHVLYKLGDTEKVTWKRLAEILEKMEEAIKYDCDD